MQENAQPPAQELGGGGEYIDKNFSGLLVREKTISGASFDGCTFRNCDFTGTQLRHCKFRDCSFRSCNLSLVKIHGTLFAGVSFKDSKLLGVNWTEADWPRIKLGTPPAFAGCILNDSNFLGLKLGGIKFTDCTARGADFREADLSKAEMNGTDLSGALFGNTDLTGADFSGARSYSIRISENKVKGAKFSMPEAMNLLYCLDIKIV